VASLVPFTSNDSLDYVDIPQYGVVMIPSDEDDDDDDSMDHDREASHSVDRRIL